MFDNLLGRINEMERELKRLRRKTVAATSWGADTSIDGVPALVAQYAAKLLAEQIPGTYYAQAYVETDTTGGNKTTESSLAVKTPNNNAVVFKLILSEDDATGVVVERYADINAPLKLDALTSDPASGPDGLIWYNATDDKFRAFVNGSKVDITTGGGALKVQNGGYYLIPAGPAVGTTVTSSASSNTYGSWTEMRAASGNALYIVGVTIRGLETVQYLQLDIGTGAAASETSVSETKVHGESTGTVGIDQTIYFPYPIAVAANIRIACRVADEDASAKNATVTLIVVDQTDVTTI